MKINQVKSVINDILNSGDEHKGWIYKIDDVLINGLIVLNVIAIILESFHDIYLEYHNFFYVFELFSVAIFTFEYILRIWVADIYYLHLSGVKARFRYIFSLYGLIDIIAILPFYIPNLIKLDLRFVRILRLLRLFRIFKLIKYSSSLQLIGNVIKNRKNELLITIFVTTIIILIASSLMYELENEVQPDKFPNILASFWWAVATLTTIGYGDVYPLTGWGQFLAAITAIFGIGLVAVPTGILSMGFVEEIGKKNSKKEKNKCPHCGESLE